MDKEMLAQLLKSRYGDDFDVSLITDEDLVGLQQQVQTEIEDEVEQDDDLDQNTTLNNVDDYEDDDLDLDDIDEDKLTDGERMLYRALKKEKEKARRESLNKLIAEADISDINKNLLSQMVSMGIDKETLVNNINSISESMNKSKRQIPGAKMFSKKQVKIDTGLERKKAIAFGTKDFGKSLVRKK